MIPTKNSLYVNPSKQTASIVTFIWVIGILGLITEKSNFFTRAFSLKEFTLFVIFLAATGSGLIIIWRNFHKNKGDKLA